MNGRQDRPPDTHSKPRYSLLENKWHRSHRFVFDTPPNSDPRQTVEFGILDGDDITYYTGVVSARVTPNDYIRFHSISDINEKG